MYFEEKVVKQFEYDTFGCGLGSRIPPHWKGGKAAIILYDDKIMVEQISGPAPMARDVILFLLADKDIRYMIRQYQQDGYRQNRFALRETLGISGRMDIYINFYTKNGCQIDGKKLLHVSQYGKLNEGWHTMWIGDFVELVAYIMERSEASYELSNPKRLRHMSNCKYIKGYFNDDAQSKISKII